MAPEQKARVSIDTQLQQAGWHVCSMADANIHASRGVALREFPLNTGYGFADYLLYIDEKAAGVIEVKKEGATLKSKSASMPKLNVAYPSFVALRRKSMPISSARRRCDVRRFQRHLL